jgi:hypothetical protein
MTATRRIAQCPASQWRYLRLQKGGSLSSSQRSRARGCRRGVPDRMLLYRTKLCRASSALEIFHTNATAQRLTIFLECRLECRTEPSCALSQNNNIDCYSASRQTSPTTPPRRAPDQPSKAKNGGSKFSPDKSRALFPDTSLDLAVSVDRSNGIAASKSSPTGSAESLHAQIFRTQ